MAISLSGSLNLSGSLTTTGTITATTLVVQTITSSISSITGSTNFGTLSSDTHKFTGSMFVTGSLLVTGSSTLSGSIATTGNITLNKTSPNIFMRGGYTQDLGFFLNNEPAVYIVDDATATKGIKVNISTGAISQLGSGSVSFTGAATFSSTITAGVITGDSLSTGVPSIVAKVGSGGNNGTFGFGNNSNYRIRGGSDYGAMIFDTAGAEYMRIQSDGTILAGTTNDGFFNGSVQGVGLYGSNGFIAASRNGSIPGFFNRYTSTGELIQFRYAGSSVGNISTNGSTITFSGTAVSDARYKEDIQPITDALDAINAAEFVTFKFKENNKDSAGVTAQNLQTIEKLSPFVINGITEEDYKAVDYNALIGYMGKAIQELTARVQYLENK